MHDLGGHHSIEMHFQASDKEAGDEEVSQWLRSLAELMKCNLRHTIESKRFEMAQQKSKRLYESNFVRWLFAALIVCSFASDVAQAQFLPEEGGLAPYVT